MYSGTRSRTGPGSHGRGTIGLVVEPVAAIALSNSTIAEDASVGALIGTLSVVNATGTPSFTLDDDDGGLTVLDGNDVETADALDFETHPTITITVSVSGTTPSISPTVFNIAVSNVNEAPTVANAISDQSATEDVAFSFQFASNVFADVDVGDTLTYSATQGDDSPLPAWITFTAATRTFAGTPATGDVGTLTVKVTATDGGALTATDTFDIVVASAGGGSTAGEPIGLLLALTKAA